MMMTDTDALSHPLRGRRPSLAQTIAFGFPPMAFGDPGHGHHVHPLWQDRSGQDRGQAHSRDWALMPQQSHTDPSKVAGLHPVAGPKGSGLAWSSASLQRFSRACPGGRTSTRCTTRWTRSAGWGTLYGPGVKRFLPLEQFKRELGQMLQEMNAIHRPRLQARSSIPVKWKRVSWPVGRRGDPD